MQDHIDSQLITKYLAGDEESLEVLVKRYLKPVYSFVYRYIGSEQEAERCHAGSFCESLAEFEKV